MYLRFILNEVILYEGDNHGRDGGDNYGVDNAVLTIMMVIIYGGVGDYGNDG